MSLRARLPVLVADAFAADDRALVRRFAESRDEAAFAAVVARHARMVYGVCRRAVRDEHLAEDAFQAVFLVLANHPFRAISANAVGGWLFGVARRVGLAARRREERFARRQAKTACNRRCDEPPDFDDLLRVLDEELAALPDEFRAPLVACFLEERTLDEAARHLGWSVSTLRRRLDRAKDVLRARLTRRNATLSAGLFAGFLAPTARATVPPRLVEAASPSAKPTTLAIALAAEFGRGSVAFKAALAAVMALGLGGLALGTGSTTNTPELPRLLPLPPPAHRAVAPAPAPRVRAAEAAWTTVRGRVVFPEGQALPATRAVTPNTIKDAGFFGAPLYRDALISARTRGIANVVVWLCPDSGDEVEAFPTENTHPALLGDRPVTRSILLTHDGYSPRVTAARAGDRLLFSNPTPVSFTIRYESPGGGKPSSENHQFNVLLPPGGSHTTSPLVPTRQGDSLADNIHPWVRGFVWVFDHPYFAVTDERGDFAIPDAPVGTWRLVVWHEKAGYLTRARGGRGERIVIAPDRELKVIALESLNWGK